MGGHMDQICRSECIFAARSDSLLSSHPVEVNCRSAGQVMEIFDAISYYKGSSVIRMLADYLGVDAFRKGLCTYLKDKQFSCATTEDLWSHCSKASGCDVAAFMDNWIKKTGYPFVSASSSTPSSANHISITLKQKRFLANGAECKEGIIWNCSVRVIIGVEKEEKVDPIETMVMFNKEVETFELALPNGCQNTDNWWIKINKNISGFFRVMYSKDLSDSLTRNVITNLGPIDRLSIQTDYFALTTAGCANTADAIRMAASYRDEKSYSVWSDLDESLHRIMHYCLLENKPYTGLMKEFFIWLYEKIVADVTWEAQDD